MKRTTVIIAALLTIFAVTASATLLQYYGRITGTVNVKQSVVFSDGTTEKTYSFEGDVIAGNTYMDTVRIKNRANVPATVKFVDTVNGKDEEEGVTTIYWLVDEPEEIIPGEVNEVTPSTNEQNKINNWAHFDVSYEGVNAGEVKITFTQPRDFYACFEYKTDGDTSQKIKDENYNADITDGLYPYICLNPPNTERSITKTFSANEYVEVRMVFGAEEDERFDWTRVDVLGTEIQEGETFTIGAGETVTFVIVNEFDIALRPGTYTITTCLEPVVEP